MKFEFCYFLIECKNCLTSVRSTKPIFEEHFLKPIQIESESIYFDIEQIKFFIYNDMRSQNTLIYKNYLDNKQTLTTIPLISLNKIKTKEELIRKIKMIMTFS